MLQSATAIPADPLGEGDQRKTPSCDTVTDCPATVRDPCRLVRARLISTTYLTVPLPVPLLPAVIVIQLAPLAAVHAHPPPAVTLTLPDPPVAPNEADLGSTAYVQDGGGDGGGGGGGGDGEGDGEPACDIVTVWPATVRLPLRSLDASLASTT